MSKSSELDQKAKLYILNVLSDHCDSNKVTDCIEYMRDRFTSEYGWNIKRIGEQNAMQEWLQGLAINIDYYNYHIVQLAVEWGSLPADHTDKQADRIVENYWCFMAAKCCQLLNAYRVPKGIK